MWNAKLDVAQAGIKIARRNINNLRYADDTTLMEESNEELKSLLMKGKEESEKAGLKLNIEKLNIQKVIQSHHFMANKWGNNGNSDRLFFSWAPKSLQMVSAAMKLKDGCSLPIKVCLVKNMVFPVVIYGCESWTIKKAECEGIDAFELWCWRRLMRVPWTTRRSNQSILKEINIH